MGARIPQMKMNKGTKEGVFVSAARIEGLRFNTTQLDLTTAGAVNAAEGFLSEIDNRYFTGRPASTESLLDVSSP
jgi:hypothetical protein